MYDKFDILNIYTPRTKVSYDKNFSATFFEHFEYFSSMLNILSSMQYTNI